MSDMQLQYLFANQAWVFTFGDSLVRLRDHGMFFADRKQATDAAERCGLVVADLGNVHAAGNTPEGAIADRLDA